jgi:hypothetical protein
MEKYNPQEDGITHINIYSKGKTELGRWLSNFAYAPIETEDGPFNSIEGYWYWLSCGYDILRRLSGYRAKITGRNFGGKDWVFTESFRTKIKKAIEIKLKTYSEKLVELKQTDLPLAHYYVYDNNVIIPKNCDWIICHIDSLRKKN